ncbi:TetR/AcrR family transcriptional regulator [Pseudoxanthomonas sp. Root630]|uniref:TetR/AcrR family transcriptional regulator n=1 Tax=Pseudoxanthomonas sp. Root630 TaxID=1736574 RepID=UPI0007031ECE|nr:TetR/AcrR family transcriptional regulator [Pseudoxanthomonas sp. Root630]KRA50866.1 hypothetical protein ASD72_17670 [Pseudoxanthomonas sp. Root630]
MSSGNRLRWERAREQTRAAIIEAASRAFEATGYDDTCMNRIAQIAGYTKTTVYSHFRDKGRLFAAVMESHASRFHLIVLPPMPMLALNEALAYVALEIQKLAQVSACRRYCATIRRSGSGMGFYVELWAAYLAPCREFVHVALVREGVELAKYHADLYLQLMLQANSLQIGLSAEPNAQATLDLFQLAFGKTSLNDGFHDDAGLPCGPGSSTKQ